MKHLIIMVFIVLLPLSACGVKGALKPPAHVEKAKEKTS